MEFRKVRALRGPNVWAQFPVLEAWVDLGALKDSPSDELPGFNERLTAWLPSLVEHRCSVGTRGGFFERLRRGTYQAHILEHVALELQSLAGTDGKLLGLRGGIEGDQGLVHRYPMPATVALDRRFPQEPGGQSAMVAWPTARTVVAENARSSK